MGLSSHNVEVSWEERLMCMYLYVYRLSHSMAWSGGIKGYMSNYICSQHTYLLHTLRDTYPFFLTNIISQKKTSKRCERITSTLNPIRFEQKILYYTRLLFDDDDCFYYIKTSSLVLLVEGSCNFEFSVLRSCLLLCYFGRKIMFKEKSS